MNDLVILHAGGGEYMLVKTLSVVRIYRMCAKNTVIGAGYTPSDITDAFETAVRNDVAESKRRCFPMTRYDAASKRAYFEAADGTREYVNG